MEGEGGELISLPLMRRPDTMPYPGIKDIVSRVRYHLLFVIMSLI